MNTRSDTTSTQSDIQRERVGTDYAGFCQLIGERGDADAKHLLVAMGAHPKLLRARPITPGLIWEVFQEVAQTVDSGLGR